MRKLLNNLFGVPLLFKKMEEPKDSKKRKQGPTHALTLPAKRWPDDFFSKWEHTVVYLKGEKKAQIQCEKFRRLAFFLPNAEAAWNPLVSYPRNKGCWCGSGVKAKKCCLPLVNRSISKRLASQIISQWDGFMTGHATLPKAVQEKKAA